MIATEAAAFKYKGKCKKPEKPILVEGSKESLPPYVPLYRLENF
jgi:hypothetical protein